MDLDKSIKYLKFQCRKLLNGKFDDEYFILSKTLNKDYKDRSRHGHVILADKMIERNSENKPAINDRI
jgi:DNA polymerase elongation subunit (family B)